MSNILKGSLNLFSLTTNTLGISCKQDDDLLRVEIDLNTMIYISVLFVIILIVIYVYNLIKEKSVRLKSSVNLLN